MNVETKDLPIAENEVNISSVEQAREKEMPAHSPRRKNARTIRAMLMIGLCVLLLVVTGLAVFGFTRSARLQAKIDEQNKQLTAQSEQLQTKESEKDALQQQNDTLKSEKDTLQKEKDTLKKEADALRSQIALKKQQQQGNVQAAPQKPAITVAAPSNGSRPLVALTFDDGPGPYTERLLDILKEQGVKATFFMLGNRISRYPDLVKRMEAEGHTLGNHSYDHAYLSGKSSATVSANLENCNKQIRNLVGHNAAVVRFPYGAADQTAKNAAAAVDMPVIYWSVDTLDWKYRNVDSILNISFGKSGIRDGSIVLMHDIHKSTVDAMPEMIKRLKAQNYQFVTVPELLTLRRGGMVPGKVYGSAYP